MLALQGMPRLDHVNVVVRDLEQAGRTYQRLGFTLKQGRPHANSIRNLHIKFSDTTEIELITADEPRDALARRYIALKHAGEGGAHFAVRGAGEASAEEMFFVQPLTSPTDSAHHFVHRNGAYRLLEVWLSEGDSVVAQGVRYVPLPRAVTRIVGATVAVRDVAATAAVLAAALERDFNIASTPRGRSLRIPPSLAHGLWLEFLERP